MGDLAKALAVAAIRLHEATDKNGEPLLLHVCRVVDRVGALELNLGSAEERESAMVVAALHDVVEDGAGWSSREQAMEWLQERFSVAVVNAVSALSRRKGEEYLRDYIGRVCASRLASLVKLADLDDNLNRPVWGEDAARYTSRVERYWKARHMVSAAIVAART